MKRMQPMSVPFSYVEILVFPNFFLTLTKHVCRLIVTYCTSLCLGQSINIQNVLSDLYNPALNADIFDCSSLSHWVNFSLGRLSSP